MGKWLSVLLRIPFCMISHFFPAFKILPLSLYNVIIIRLSVGLFEFILLWANWGHWICRSMYFIDLGKFLTFLQIFLLLLLSSSGTPIMNMLLHWMVSYRSLGSAYFSSILFIPFCSSCWIISSDLFWYNEYIWILTPSSWHKALKMLGQGFPGGAVVENLPANAGDTGSCPGLGRSHMPRSN